MSDETTKIVDLRPSKAATDLVNAPDEFADEQWKYPASNAKGGGVPITVRIPPEEASLISNIVASRRFPYGDKSDLIRHAIFYHVGRLSQAKSFGHGTLHAQVMVINRLMQEQEYNQDFLDVISRMERFVHLCIQRNDKTAAAEMVEAVRREVARMNPKSWRHRYNAEINRKIGRLLQSNYEVDGQIVTDGMEG